MMQYSKLDASRISRQSEHNEIYPATVSSDKSTIQYGLTFNIFFFPFYPRLCKNRQTRGI